MVINIVNTILFSFICFTFFILKQPLGWVEIVLLIGQVLFWLLPNIVKPKRCVSCGLINSEPIRKNFVDNDNYKLAKDLWTSKKKFLDKMSTDIMQDIGKDLFIIHQGTVIMGIYVVESYALGHATSLDKLTGQFHTVSTLGAYLEYFEDRMLDG